MKLSALPLDKGITCSACRWSRSCWRGDDSRSLVEALSPIVNQSYPIAAGTILFHQGTPISLLYVVMVGSVKNYVLEADGTEQILNFNLPGEILGLQAFGQTCYTSTVATLESTVVCAFPYTRLQILWESRPELRLNLFQRLADDLADKRTLVLSMAQRAAEARLAGFLLRLSERMAERGLCSNEFNLSMSRRDMGNYLGVNQETVSRLLTRFQQARLLSANCRSIQLHDIAGLQSIAQLGARRREHHPASATRCPS